MTRVIFINFILALAYIVASFFTILSSEGKGSSNQTQKNELFRIARVTKKEFKRVETIVQKCFHQWKIRKKSKRNMSANVKYSISTSSSKRAKYLGNATLKKSDDTDFVNSLDKVLSDKFDRLSKNNVTITESSKCSSQGLFDSISNRFSCASTSEEWKRDIKEKARSEHTSVEAAVDCIEKKYNMQ